MSIIWYPENPYVLNPFYFNNITNQRYDQTWSGHIHRINNICAAIFGTCTSLLVIYLVFKKTLHNFRVYSRLILLCSFVDLYYLAGDVLTQLRFRIIDDATLFTAIGLQETSLSYNQQCNITIMLFTSAQTISYCMLPFKSFYRYCTLKNNTSPTVLQTFTYGIICIALIVLTLFTSTEAFYSTKSAGHFDYGTLWYPETPIPKLFVAIQSNASLRVHTIIFGLICILCYTLSIWFARSSVIEIRRNAQLLSPKTIALQNQFGRSLIAQTLIPLITVVVPVGASALAILFTIGNIGECVRTTIVWYPFLNSLCNLIFIVPYRNQVLKPFILLYNAGRKLIYSAPIEPFNNSSTIN